MSRYKKGGPKTSHLPYGSMNHCYLSTNSWSN